MSNLISYLFAVNAISAMLVGSYVYFMGKKKEKNAIWLVYNILFSIWNFCIYKALEPEVGAASIYWFRSSLAAMMFLVPVFLHFLSIYSNKEIFKKQVLGKIYIIFFLFFTFSFIAPKHFIKDITESFYFRHIIVPGHAFTIFAVVFAGFLLCGFYYLLHSTKLYLSFKRNQRLWLFWGMLLGVFAPLNFFLAAYKINFFPFGLLCVFPYLAMVSYPILKYHVFEIDTLINKTVVLSYFTLFVLVIHLFIVHVLHRLVGIEYFICSIISGGIVLINLLFTAHYSGVLKLGKITDRIVYEKKLSYYKFLEDFSSIAAKTADLTDIANYALDSLIATVAVAVATLYLFDEDNREFKLIAYKGVHKKTAQEISTVSISSPLVGFLKEGNVYVAGKNEDFAEDCNLDKIKKAFEGINMKRAIPLSYSFPLYHGGDIVGFLNLGNKKDNSPYNTEDTDILNAFGRQLSICIDKAKLYSRAIEDDLTRLYRVNYFNKRVQEEIARANRYKRPFSLAIMDIDDFKKINDTFGHQTGDEVLKRIANVIKSTIRRVDIAGRYGGEEFSVLMPETNKTNALLAAERLRKSIEEEFKGEERFKITISIGVADHKPGMKSYDLIKVADEALYRAKRAGKNQVVG